MNVLFRAIFVVAICVSILAGAGSVDGAQAIDFLLLPDKNFKIENANSVDRSGNGSLIIRGAQPTFMGRIDARSTEYRTLSMKLQSSKDVIGFVFWSDGRSKPNPHSFVIEKSEVPKEYTFDLWTFQDFKGPLLFFGFGFQEILGKENVLFISEMFLYSNGSSSEFFAGIKRFFTPEFITFRSINVLYGPMLWNGSLNFWIGTLFIFIAAFLFVLSVTNHRISRYAVLKLFFTLCLCFWIFSDMRNIINLAAIGAKDFKDLLEQPPYEKTYDDLNDFYGFIHFVEDQVSPTAALSFVSIFEGTYDLWAEYFLRPRKIRKGFAAVSGQEEYLVLYRYPVKFDEGLKIVRIAEKEFPYEEAVHFKGDSYVVRFR